MSYRSEQAKVFRTTQLSRSSRASPPRRKVITFSVSWAHSFVHVLAVSAAVCALGSSTTSAKTSGTPRDIVDLVVIHSIGGPACNQEDGSVYFTGSRTLAENTAFFEEEENELGIHYLIGRGGELVASVPEMQIAYHALGANDTSIGIELINRGNGEDPYSEPQVQALIELLKGIRQRHNVSIDRIVGHSEVDDRTFQCGGRTYKTKQDPGDNFPWQRVREALTEADGGSASGSGGSLPIGTTYQLADESRSVLASSADQLELKELVEYSITEDGRVRAVAKAFGEPVVLYFSITEDGLVDEEGRFYISHITASANKLSQKQTVGDMRDVGAAWFTWLTDQVVTPATPSGSRTLTLPVTRTLTLPVTGSTMDGDSLCAILCPAYIQSVPNKDGWGNPYTYFYSGGPPRPQIIVIHSGGRDGSRPKASYVMGPFPASDYDEDIVWVDGFFARYPAGKRVD